MKQDKKILKAAAVDAGATALYIALIASLLFNAQTLFGNAEDKGVLVPIAMLTLFVTSAAVTGFAVFGRPVMWYLDGKKKESLTLLGWTIGFLGSIALLLFISLAF